MHRNSLALRLMLGAGVWIVLALVASGVLLATLFEDYVERNFRQTLGTYQQTLIAVIDLESDRSLAITRPLPDPRFDQPLSGWYWQVNRGDRVEARSRSLWDQALSALPNTRVGDERVMEGPNGERLWVAQREFRLPGDSEPITILVGADSETMRADLGSFNTVLAWALGALGALYFAAGFLQIRFGLRPLRRIEATLGAIRDGKLSRLGEDFPREIVPLAQEINSLLDHNATIIERARTQAGNLAHALKTPLTILRNDASMPAEGRLSETVGEQVAVMQQHIDYHLQRARAAGARGVLGVSTDVETSIGAILRVMSRLYEEKNPSLEATVEPGLKIACEQEDVDEVLGNLLDNACKWAHTHVKVSANRHGNVCRLRIEDDGPGIDGNDRATALNRGERLDETKPGTGLGLAIVNDIVAMYGGSVELNASSLGGLAVLVVLPVSPNP